MNYKLFQNKSVRIAITIGLFILVLVIILSPKRESSPAPTQDIVQSQERPELIDLNQQKRREAMIYTDSISAKLPLYLESLETSVGITTSINIYRLGDDEAEIVRLEIYGLSYLNRDTDESKNPNVTAFKESYLKAIEMIEGQNIDPKRLIFIYGDKEYVRETTHIWLTALGIRP